MQTFREEKTEPASVTLGQLKPGTWFALSPATSEIYLRTWPVVVEGGGARLASVRHHDGCPMSYGDDVSIIPVIPVNVHTLSKPSVKEILWREARPDEFPQFLKDVPQPDRDVS